MPEAICFYKTRFITLGTQNLFRV